MIPRIYHYYWTGEDFQYVHYLAVLSLVKSTPCERIEIHFEQAPRGNPHWDRLRDFEPVQLLPVDYRELSKRAGYAPGDFEAFLAVARTVHRSDFVRYLVLAGEGGLYLDIDTLVVRDLDPLRNRPFLAGFQNPDALGNDVSGAVLGSEPGGEIVRECLERIRALPGSLQRFRLANLRIGLLRKFFAPYLHWCDSGPSLLTELSRERADLRAAICPRSYFHFCDYRRWRSIFSEGTLPEDVRVIHYFGKLSFEFTKTIDEGYLRESPSLFARAASRYVDLGSRAPGPAFAAR